MKNIFRTVFPALLLVSFFLFGASGEVSASHFRYGHLTWKPKAGVANAVEFTLINAFRRDGYPGSAGDGFPAVGDVITETVGATTLFFGDATSTPLLQYKVIAIDVAGNWLLAAALEPGSSTKTTIDHAYPGPTNGGVPWVAEINSCCRTFSEINNPSNCYRVSTLVETASGNSSPLSSLPAIVNMPQSPAASFIVPAADSDPGTALRWRLASPVEPVGAGCAPFVQPTAGGFNLTVDSLTGLVTWNTSATVVGGLYSTQIIIEDRDVATMALRTQVAVDFLIQIVSCPANTPPSFVAPSPTCGIVIPATAGVPMSFTVSASDPDSGATVILNSGGVPPGASMSPGLPTAGNPVSSTFSWTPAAADAGVHVVTFTATDDCGTQTLCSYTIVVSCPPATITPSGPTSFCEGGSVTLTASAGVSFSWSTGETTQSITVSASGTYVVTVTDSAGCVGTDSISVTVFDSPVADAGAAATVYLGYAPLACDTLNASASAGTPPYTFSWNTGASASSIIVCPATTTTYTVTVTDANGCTDTDTVTVTVIDVRCGNKNDKVLVCHYPPGNPGNKHNICVSPNAVPAHLAHGDILGSCGGAKMDPGTIAEHEDDLTGLRFELLFNDPSGNILVRFSTEETTPVTIDVYDLRGALVKTIYRGQAQAGTSYSVDIDSHLLPSGLYTARLVAGEHMRHARFILTE